MKQIVGRCSNCQVNVCIPTVWSGIEPPTPTCTDCGAIEDTRNTLPEIKTIPINETNQRFIQD
jgi:hypothetical protein